MTYDAAFEADVVNYVPGEIAVVASAGPRYTPRQLHDALRAGINRLLGEFLRQGRELAAPVAVADAILRQALLDDLQVPLIRKRFQSSLVGNSAGLVDLLRSISRLSAGSVPWVLFPRKDQLTAVVFFQIDADVTITPTPGDVPGDQAWQEKRDRLIAEVRELVILINHQLRDADVGPDLRVLAAMPHWLTTASAASAGGHGCGSPGGLPRPIPPSKAPSYLSRLFEFRNEQVRAFDTQAQAVTERHARGETSAPNGVVVAVLDTSPTRGDVEAAQSAHSTEADSNWLLPLVASRVAIDGALSLPPASFAHLVYRPNWHGPEMDRGEASRDASFAMADHGLFVAGLIYHLSPASEIHLIRVLDEFGVGDLHAIATALTQLPDHLLTGGDQRLVVNLSLGAEVPLAQRFLPRWFPGLARTQRLPESNALQAYVSSFRDLIHSGLKEAITWLFEHGVLIVAAVGNDYYVAPVGRKDPRYPAAYDCVLGVAALASNDSLADYTNAGDEPEPTVRNGVATFGGNTKLPGGPGSGPPLTDAPPNAVKGIFTAAELPLNGGPNESGWVEWAGTSFATPIISAIAANLWAASLASGSRVGPPEIIRAINGLREPDRSSPVPVIVAQVP
jgi:hypothetical protein